MEERRFDNPCIRHCCLNEEDVCLGCGRHLNEILGWTQSNAAQQQEILARSQARLAALKARVYLHHPK
ncbi:DUF1289 domain-containing protein [Vibrio vulnificus]|uniref:DUF1289 domain-containing protein n=1 Tax=Vibrio TaxID=662 RepID=UPI0013025B5B|nr:MULTISPECIES: DUF1289 domain-containing protein [Vibrio]EGR0108639.1 DUF1289 domain-containing protein [Vibrio vulnificus]EHH0794738.1 DUF1289 domain-containing protein [Vibrio vulnificus]EHI9272011.1 DUF1289 domain-containing protein [Vibrio vulnificus]EIF5016990.1 DUF1289 domain-containing protein [Vibrio vulnificus]EIO2323150.1 DUF1289 domain-containing protein [Vibrio vulnificus]